MNEERKQCRIVIVDDNLNNLFLLEKILRENHFEVMAYQSGDKALKAMRQDVPDMILLDVAMPGIDGFELCRQIKSQPDLSRIPIIFITIMTDVADIIKGYHLGGVDYITKPFHSEEVIMRVSVHLIVQELLEKLENQNEHLEHVVRRRTAELEEANKLLKRLDEIKSDFLTFISHELRTPLNGLMGITGMLIEKLNDKGDEDFKMMYEDSKQRLLNLVDDALLLNEIESFPGYFESCKNDLECIINDAISEATAAKTDLIVDVDTSRSRECGISGEKELMVKAFKYLITTAYMFSAAGESVKVTVDSNANPARIEIRAEGKSIDDAAIESFFDFYSDARTSTYAEHMGLAPVVAAKVISLFGGAAKLSKSAGEGVVFEVTLPQ